MIASEKNTPLPEITDLTRPFWAAAKAHKLVVQKCARCNACNFHPKPWCVDCGCRDLPWTEVSGNGKVYTFTISRAVAMNLPGWQRELPIVMALVDLDEGARLYAQVTDCDPAAMRIDLPVEVWFEDISEEAAIPKFRPRR